MAICTNCGCDNRHGVRFCTQCGNGMASPPPEAGGARGSTVFEAENAPVRPASVRMGGAASPPTVLEAPTPRTEMEPARSAPFRGALAARGHNTPRTVLHEEVVRPIAGWMVILKSYADEIYREIPIYRGRNVIGRDPALGPQSLKDSNCSGQHCSVSVLDDVTELRDLDSSNGTRVNNQRVRGVHLSKGDMVRIGKTTLVFLPLSQPRVQGRRI